MTDVAALPPVADSAQAAQRARGAMQRRLKRRHAAEARFKWYGRLAVLVALGFLALLLTRVVTQGYTAFWAHSIELE
ncbi:MAG: DUF3333 domain-containing protein, partial [Gemmatimonadetes bacterium]|nr:DUF3333 domain-containing protein [Gemmatimonadota bacterium]